jgi:hypothetical protein
MAYQSAPRQRKSQQQQQTRTSETAQDTTLVGDNYSHQLASTPLPLLEPLAH